MKADIVNITPTLAQSWLEQGINFRTHIQAHSSAMCADMKSGRWDENGESIKFNTKDQLIDGQHRLLACVEAGVPFKSVVVYGVKSDLNIDTGAKRALHQWLKHHGVNEYHKDIASSIRVLHGLLGGNGFECREGRRPTNHDLIKVFKQHDGIKDSVARVQCVKSELCQVSIVAPLHYLLHNKDAPLAEKFMLALENKLELRNTDPVMMLRERLLADRSAKLRMGRRAKAALIIIAWNHWREGTSTKILKFIESGPTSQDFPEIS